MHVHTGSLGDAGTAVSVTFGIAERGIYEADCG